MIRPSHKTGPELTLVLLWNATLGQKQVANHKVSECRFSETIIIPPLLWLNSGNANAKLLGPAARSSKEVAHENKFVPTGVMSNLNVRFFALSVHFLGRAPVSRSCLCHWGGERSAGVLCAGGGISRYVMSVSRIYITLLQSTLGKRK